MTRVYFVRHAQPNYLNHDDLSRELSPKGMEDRKLVTSFMQDKGVTTAVSSPFRRAIDTIRDFTDSAGLKIEIIDDFRERKVDSVWIEDFPSFVRLQWADFGYSLSDGECLREVQQRNITALTKLVADHTGESIIVGSHGTALGTVINYYDRSFGYDEFIKVQCRMPWIAEFDFDDDLQCRSIIYHNLY